MTATVARPSADVAVRVLRDRLVVVAGAVEQLPEGSPVRRVLGCTRDTYAYAIAELSHGTDVAALAAGLVISSAVAKASGVSCCEVAHLDVLNALGG